MFVFTGLFSAISVTPKTKFYHEKFPRVREIWDCNVSDLMCVFEAEEQFDRDKLVTTLFY